MPNSLINKRHEETGLSIAKLEKLWQQAKAISSKKNLKGDSFYKMANAIFEKLVKNSVKKESLKVDIDDVICEFIEYLDEETVSGDVAQPDSMLCGKPCFHVDDDIFFKIGFSNRKKKGWRNKFYGTSVGNWSRKNKGQDFYIKHNNKDLLMLIKRDRYNSNKRIF